MKSLFLSSLLALGLLAVPAQAAEYPAKPITLMTAFNAGGGSDVSHRLLEKFAKGVFDQPIVVTYKAGAGGEIGWTWLVGAKADGYTIGGVDLPHIVLQPMLRPEGQPGYKTEQLSPLCGLVYDADVVMVPEDGPYKTFKDLIEYAKANPGKVKVATVGKLTGDHLFLMQIEKLTGAKFTQVPYSGSGKAIPALLSGEVDAYFGSGSSFLRMEKTRGLAIGSKERYELCPDVPTFKEQGVDFCFYAQPMIWLAPAGTDPEVCKAFNEILNQIYTNPNLAEDFKTKLSTVAHALPSVEESTELAKEYAEAFCKYVKK